MVQRSVASIVQRFEALPIIIVFALLIALFMYWAAGGLPFALYLHDFPFHLAAAYSAGCPG